MKNVSPPPICEKETLDKILNFLQEVATSYYERNNYQKAQIPDIVYNKMSLFRVGVLNYEAIQEKIKKGEDIESIKQSIVPFIRDRISNYVPREKMASTLSELEEIAGMPGWLTQKQ